MKRNKMDIITGILFVGLLILALYFSTAAASQVGSAPLPRELQNGSFTGFAVTDKLVMLKNGKWQGEPYDKGAASRPEIMLLAGTYLADYITVGMIGATRMMCPPPIDAAEIRFQKLLGSVTGFSFDSGRLVLSYTEGDSGGALFFERKQNVSAR